MVSQSDQFLKELTSSKEEELLTKSDPESLILQRWHIFMHKYWVFFAFFDQES